MRKVAYSQCSKLSPQSTGLAFPQNSSRDALSVLCFSGTNVLIPQLLTTFALCQALIDGRMLRIKFKAKKRLTLTLAHTLIIEPPPIQFFLCKLPLVLKDRKPPLQFQILLGLCSESTYSPLLKHLPNALLKHLPDSKGWASVAGIESTSLSVFPVFKTVPRGKITKDVINATVRVKK